MESKVQTQLETKTSMSRRQLITLFTCGLVTMFVGSGLIPLLPLYAMELGAKPIVVGNYLAIVYLALALGTVSIGWLASRFQRRRTLFIATTLVCAPATLLMGQAANIWQLTVFTAIAWFAGGAGLALINILAGLFAGKHERGKVFGVLALTAALGALLGGLVTGPIVDHWGYATLFRVLSLCFMAQLIGGLFLRDKHVSNPIPSTRTAGTRQEGFGSTYVLLLIVNLLVGIVGFIGVMGRSLAMDASGFAVTAVTVTAALGAGAGLLFNPLIGRLSDRFNRKALLAVTYLGNSLALVVMASATSLPDFVLVSLVSAFAAAGAAVSSALITDVVPMHKLDRGMTLFEAVKWAGGVFGFAGTGYAVHALGLQATLWLGASVPLFAIVLLFMAGAKAPVTLAGSLRPQAVPK